LPLASLALRSYVPEMQGDPFSDSLWSFNYFFFNAKLKRILYFTCVSRQAGRDLLSPSAAGADEAGVHHDHDHSETESYSNLSFDMSLRSIDSDSH
jgi:hypothetical protein